MSDFSQVADGKDNSILEHCSLVEETPHGFNFSASQKGRQEGAKGSQTCCCAAVGHVEGGKPVGQVWLQKGYSCPARVGQQGTSGGIQKFTYVDSLAAAETTSLFQKRQTQQATTRSNYNDQKLIQPTGATPENNKEVENKSLGGRKKLKAALDNFSTKGKNSNFLEASRRSRKTDTHFYGTDPSLNYQEGRSRRPFLKTIIQKWKAEEDILNNRKKRCASASLNHDEKDTTKEEVLNGSFKGKKHYSEVYSRRRGGKGSHFMGEIREVEHEENPYALSEDEGIEHHIERWSHDSNASEDEEYCSSEEGSHVSGSVNLEQGGWIFNIPTMGTEDKGKPTQLMASSENGKVLEEGSSEAGGRKSEEIGGPSGLRIH